MRFEPPISRDLWDHIPPTTQAALRAQLERYQERITALEARVRDLEHRLGQNSTNSSKPPSTDGPHVKRRPPKPPSGRPRGGQEGHPRRQRPLLPPTDIRLCKPGACRRCGRALHGDDFHPLRYQVLELPEIKPLVIEYHLHRLACPCCGITTCAPLPEGAARGGQGPRLQALLALLTGAYRLSKRQAEQLLEDVCATPVCAAQVCALEQETATLLQPVVDELKAQARTQPANVDETSWREDRHKAWLWVAVTTYLTVYQITAKRGAKELAALLGADYQHVVTSDRFKAYEGVPLERRQACWAHLRRDFQAMIDRANEGSPVGEELLFHADILFALWYKVRDGTRTRAWLRRQIEGWLRPEVGLLLDRGAACACAKTAGTCREILRVEQTLWTFVTACGVEPTNNAAERALRHAVLWRKLSHGTDSVGGSRFVANILSVVETCRQQGRKVLEFLTTCCEAALQGAVPPSLLPPPVEAGFRLSG
jgi:transposase